MNPLRIATLALATSLALSGAASAVEQTTKDDVKQSSKPNTEKAKPAASQSESPGAYVDDSVITAKVKAAIFEDATLKSAEINVETYKGMVQLSGFVITRAAINKAVELARAVKGVTSVKNDMTVKGK